jgi:fatty acid desaturase
MEYLQKNKPSYLHDLNDVREHLYHLDHHRHVDDDDDDDLVAECLIQSKVDYPKQNRIYLILIMRDIFTGLILFDVISSFGRL